MILRTLRPGPNWDSNPRPSPTIYLYLTAPARTSCLPICEWSDYKSLCAADELVLVEEHDVSDSDLQLVYVLHEVESALLQPLEVRRRPDPHRHLKYSQVIRETTYILLKVAGLFAIFSKCDEVLFRFSITQKSDSDSSLYAKTLPKNLSRVL